MRCNRYIGLALLISLLAFGCTSDEEKIARVLEKEITECKAGEGAFHEVVLFDDSTTEILRVACEEPMGEIERIDEFKARTTTGPYTWLFGVDEETGVWVLSGVSWDTFDRGKRDMVAVDTTPDVIQGGIDLVSEAQKEYDESDWIVLNKLDAALRLREKTRGKSEDPTALGPQPTAILAEARSWGKANERPDVEAAAELAVADYFNDQRNKLVSAMDNFGGGDEWLEKLIEQAKKDKNREDEKKYTDELEKLRAERPAQKKEMRRKIFVATKKTCTHLAAVPAGESAERVATIKEVVDCSPEGLAELEAQIEAPTE